jgi:hypothetical protein
VFVKYTEEGDPEIGVFAPTLQHSSRSLAEIRAEAKKHSLFLKKRATWMQVGIAMCDSICDVV